MRNSCVCRGTMKKQKTLFSYAEQGGTSDRNFRSLSRSEEEGESSDARDEPSTSEGKCIS